MSRIMIVDDSRFMCEEIRHILEGTEHEVAAVCRDAEEALETYDTLLPDIVLMDVVLPGLDGMEATQRIVEKWPGARVIVVSSLAYDDTQQAAREKGAKAVLFKPFTAQQLLDVLAGV